MPKVISVYFGPASVSHGLFDTLLELPKPFRRPHCPCVLSVTAIAICVDGLFALLPRGCLMAPRLPPPKPDMLAKYGLVMLHIVCLQESLTDMAMAIWVNRSVAPLPNASSVAPATAGDRRSHSDIRSCENEQGPCTLDEILTQNVAHML
jgi:hypothetical protein